MHHQFKVQQLHTLFVGSFSQFPTDFPWELQPVPYRFFDNFSQFPTYFPWELQPVSNRFSLITSASSQQIFLGNFSQLLTDFP
jgi:hypothetical protein